jgi:Natural resistance-associated macrophage protein
MAFRSFSGGRTSESEEVQGDVAPDFAATGTGQLAQRNDKAWSRFSTSASPLVHYMLSVMREMVSLFFATTLAVAGDSGSIGSIEIAAHLPAPLESRTQTGKSLGACRAPSGGPGVIKPGTVSPTTSSRTTTCWAAAGERDIVEERKATKHCVKARPRIKIIAPLQWISVWGPGLLVMLADTDAGNVVTAAQAGAQWRYRLLPLLIVLMPMLYMVQELTVRLGIYTGRGHGELIRERFGVGWAWLSTAGFARQRSARWLPNSPE